MFSPVGGKEFAEALGADVQRVLVRAWTPCAGTERLPAGARASRRLLRPLLPSVLTHSSGAPFQVSPTSRPVVRKKAALCLLRLYRKNPDILNLDDWRAPLRLPHPPLLSPCSTPLLCPPSLALRPRLPPPALLEPPHHAPPRRPAGRSTSLPSSTSVTQASLPPSAPSASRWSRSTPARARPAPPCPSCGGADALPQQPSVAVSPDGETRPSRVTLQRAQSVPRRFQPCLLKVVRLLERLVRCQDILPEYIYYGVASPWLQARKAPALTPPHCTSGQGGDRFRRHCMAPPPSISR